MYKTKYVYKILCEGDDSDGRSFETLAEAKKAMKELKAFDKRAGIDCSSYEIIKEEDC